VINRSQNQDEIHLLLEWENAEVKGRILRAGIGSLIAHLFILMGLGGIVVYDRTHPPEPRDLTLLARVMPLIAPTIPTQTAPNKGKLSQEFDVESLRPRPAIQTPQSTPSTSRPAAAAPAEIPVPAPLPTPAPPPKPVIPDPPKIEIAQQQTPQNLPPAAGVPSAPPPQIQAQEKPKLAFETPGLPSAFNRQPGGGQGRLAPPSTSVEELARASARPAKSPGVTVGDMGDGIGGIGEGINRLPTPGKVGSNLELLSDPMGVDFRPYLIKVLAMVRRNWFAVIPESVRLGRRGRTVVQFAINKDGGVPKLVIAVPSGADSLDRAAVAGVSASNPFPPLPGEFSGTQIRLQFTFSYNMTR
jgi:TonB family protein